VSLYIIYAVFKKNLHLVYLQHNTFVPDNLMNAFPHFHRFNLN
jgi:hypothetical protein